MPKKTLLQQISLIGLFLLCLSLVFILLVKVEDIVYNNSLTNNLRAEWDQVRTIVTAGYIDAGQNAKHALEKIEVVAKNSYKGKDKQLSYDIKNHALSPITTAMSDSIKNTWTFNIVSDANDGFIADDDGVRDDGSADCASFGPSRTWEQNLTLQYNPELAKKNIAYMKLRPTTNPYNISKWNYWQFRKSKYNFKFQEMDEAYLHQIFLDHKGDFDIFESLEFNFIQPVYANKDLGGIPQYINGVVNKESATFWIVMGFNLIEIINGVPEYKASINSFDYERQQLDTLHKLFQFILIAGGIVIVVAFFFVFVLISNTVEREEEANKNKTIS